VRVATNALSPHTASGRNAQAGKGGSRQATAEVLLGRCAFDTDDPGKNIALRLR
jgi:hypothetical protein